MSPPSPSPERQVGIRMPSYLLALSLHRSPFSIPTHCSFSRPCNKHCRVTMEAAVMEERDPQPVLMQARESMRAVCLPPPWA